MTVLRTWSGRQALAGLIACFVVLQALVAGLHTAYTVDLLLLASDLASICHGGKSDTGAPAQPGSDLASTCCLLGCSVAGHTAKLPDASASTSPPRDTASAAAPVRSFALLPSHLIDRAHRPRSPPVA
jgi:hypothetical protein